MQYIYSDIKFIYVIIKLLNISIFILFGYIISHSSNKSYWKYSKILILSYTLTEGLRFGRMVDYNLYYERYIEIGKNFDSTTYEPLFKIICWILYNIGIPYQGFILLCSFILIYATLYLAQDYKKYLLYIVLLFLWETTKSENYIRWYLAFSLFLFSIYHLKHKKHILYILFSISSLGVHTGMFPVIILSYILYKIKRIILPHYLVEILFIICVFAGSVSVLMFLVPYVTYFAIGENMQVYANNFEALISGNLGVLGIHDDLGTIANIRLLLAYSIPILYMKKIVQEKKIHVLDINLFIIGIIIMPIFNQVEILDRYAAAFMYFSIFASASTYYNILNNKNTYPYIKIIAIICFLAAFWPSISDIFSRNKWYYLLFIWDANGSNYIPIDTF